MQKRFKYGLMLFSLCFLIACEPKFETKPTQLAVDLSLCDFYTGNCIKNVNEVAVQLSFAQPDAPSEKPIDLTVTFSNAVSDVKMSIEGRDMFMGVIPVFLNTDDKQTYQSQLIYGSCSSGYMVWRANITFDYQGVTRQVWFDFLADAQP
ncbi:hypothetical protein [Shewanella holmiensis]|uniref:Lipoprotein n=1 Tax=Shewanella holmiensis TaxID=2952222 RepID=A0A9X2WLY9_9GAMM|nr:hypothetical protein [Shewanella holmiensis]MCT7941788.1 hypothetical protein [Shewanella holmiensis]